MRVLIHQLLHGYRDGHELLASSRAVDRGVRRQLLTLSDLSGEDLVRGFDTYLSGYSVDADSFALARTWYAGEMERPGCVWTHTLLIPIRDDAMRELHRFAGMLRRPRLGAFDVSSYERAMEVSLGLDTDLHARDDSNSDVNLLLASLYTYSGSCIVVPAESAIEYESLVLSTWSRLHRKVRSDLWFSTGSLALRQYRGRSFDLQVIPAATRRRVLKRARTHDALVLEGGLTQLKDDPSTRAVAEMLGRAQLATDLERLMESYGSVSRAEMRVAFHALETVESLRTGTVAAQDYVARMLEVTLGGRATDLARTLLTTGDGRLLSDAFESAILRALLVSDQLTAAMAEQLDVRRRLSASFNLHEADTEAIEWVLDTKLGGAGANVVSEFLDSLAPDTLHRLALGDSHIICRALVRSPERMTNPSFWGGPRSIQDGGVAAIRSVGPPVRAQALRAAFRAEGCLVHDGLLSAMSPSEWPTIVESLSENAGIMRPACLRSWTRALVRHRWLTEFLPAARMLSAEFVTGLLLSADGNLPSIAAAIAPDALIAGLSPEHGAERLSEASRAALLVVGFCSDSAAGASLASLVFDRVHQDALASALSPQSWQMLHPVLPEMPLYLRWDGAERLRRGVVLRLADGRWPVTAAQSLLMHPDVRWRALAFCATFARGRAIASWLL